MKIEEIVKTADEIYENVKLHCDVYNWGEYTLDTQQLSQMYKAIGKATVQGTKIDEDVITTVKSLEILLIGIFKTLSEKNS